MSALKQVMDCQDLKRYIREFIPPHPISTIIEEGYFRAYINNMSRDCVEILNNTRLYPAEKGTYHIVLEFEKDLLFKIENVDNWIVDAIEKRMINKTFYRPRGLWSIDWITECKIKRLNHIQDGLKLQHPTYFEIFNFETDTGELTHMKRKLYTRGCLIKTCSSVMRDYYEIYKFDDEDYEDNDEDN